MARRRGREGDWLVTDDTLGWTVYGSDAKLDYWGNRTTIPLQRNLQEICTPLDDPGPVPFYRGASYEITNGCIAEVAPPTVGLTNVPTNPNNAAFFALNLDPGIGDMSVGCSFIVR